MRISNSHINTLISAGADAMSNMFEVSFLPPSNVLYDNDIIQQLKIRTRGFTPPAPTQATYDVHWKTISLKRPATKVELDRSLEFEIRVDAFYNVYKVLLAWHAQTLMAAASYATNQIPEGGQITVRALSVPIDSYGTGTQGLTEDFSDDARTLVWRFRDVWIESITSPAYSSDEASPLTVTAKFTYGAYDDPYTYSFLI